MSHHYSHYPSRSKIPPEHLAKIDELRQAFGEELLKKAWFFNDDFSLLRWLYGYDFNIPSILPNFKYAVCVLNAVKLDEHSEACDNNGNINDYVANLKPWTEYFPGGIMSFDKDGNVVYVMSCQKVHPRSLVKCAPISDLFKVFMIEVGLAYLQIRRNEEKLDTKLGLKMIVDMTGFHKDLLYPPTLKVFINLLKLMQDVFCDFARNLFVINAPFIMPSIYGLVKPVLSKQTQDKITFLSSDFQKVLCENIGEENVFVKYGGTLVPSGDKDTGNIRMGGHAPESLWYEPQQNPYHINESNLTKLSISARHKKEVKLTVDLPNSILNWFFVANNDIDFYIQKNGTDVWPKFRLPTDWVPEWGSMDCESPGEYSLIFDNSYGTFFSKEIKYFVYVNDKPSL
uniref:CRAL-TRIO domain-containing protein n=1 Tax=Panagrolaimus sp. ES5 TaxID=591445 RepID=A0AC34GVD2_9BILA